MPSANTGDGSDATALRLRRRGGLWLRILSGALLVPPALLAVYLGPPVFNALVLIVSLVMAWEWVRLCGGGRFGWTGAVLAGLVAVPQAMAVLDPLLALAVAVMAPPLVYLAAGGERRSAPLWLASGVVYIAVPCVALVWLGSEAVAGRAGVFWLLAVVWATDIGAYMLGRLLRGPRLLPRVSPSKTWAGLGGGMIAAALTGGVLGQALGAPGGFVLYGYGAALAVVAQAGDMGESAVKRRFSAKDSSGLIPGHGGILDRVDGLVTATLAVALLQLATGTAFLAW